MSPAPATSRLGKGRSGGGPVGPSGPEVPGGPAVPSGGPAPSIARRALRRVVTVKAKVGRTRYVVFRVEWGGPVSRSAMGAAIPDAKLTRFDGEHGIARTTHAKAADLVARLNALLDVGGRPVRVRTLRTSGTIKAASRAVPASSPVAKRGRRPSD